MIVFTILIHLPANGTIAKIYECLMPAKKDSVHSNGLLSEMIVTETIATPLYGEVFLLMTAINALHDNNFFLKMI